MLRVTNLSKEVGSKTLFREISFLLGNNEKIGLIGRNGTGKTTLLRIIAGAENPSEGRVLLQNEKVGYLTQEFDLPMKQMIGEYIEEVANQNNDLWRIKKILGKLDFFPDEYQEISSLSGGEKTKLMLGKLLYSSPTLLLLDEPTNHLDIFGIQWLKEFVRDYKGIVIMISHDRDLLNSTVDQIFEIDQEKLLTFSGNYDDYVEQKSGWIEKQAGLYHRYQKRKIQLESLLKQAQIRKASVGAIKTKIRHDVDEKEVKRYTDKQYKSVDITGKAPSAKLIARARNISKSYGEHKVLSNISFEIYGNDKIWLFGPNGIGKTTLVKCLIGEHSPDRGSIQIGNNVNTGYFAQKQTPETTKAPLFDYFKETTGLYESEVYSALGRYHFTKDDLETPIYLLSPGQQSRLKFAIFALGSQKTGGYQFLILDEPGHHLDIPTKEVIEQCIIDFKGAVLLISHDVYSVEQIGINRVFRMDKEVFEPSSFETVTQSL